MPRAKSNTFDTGKEINKLSDTLSHVESNVSSVSNEVNPTDKAQPEEMQVKMSKREMDKSDALHLDPIRYIHDRVPFNESYRKDYENDKQHIKCIVENYEIVGEAIETWSHPYAGVPYEFWKVPANKPVYMPRYLAKQLSKCKYRKFTMEDTITSREAGMEYTGSMVVEAVKSRVDAKPAGFNFDEGF